MARILLVEDDPDVKLLMEHVLSGAGYGQSSLAATRWVYRARDWRDMICS
jgi:CheY-like chemotaxis protein